MKVITVSDVYNVTQISKTNNEAWGKLIQIMVSETGDVEFDFQGINLEEPWNNEVFKKLLGDERVHLKVYSSQTVRDTIELACQIGNMKTDRVTNVDDVVESEEVKNVVLEALVQRFKDNIIIEKNRGILSLQGIVDQVGEYRTVQALGIAIEEFSEITGVKDFDICTELMFIQINILQTLANLICNLKVKGINMEILSRDEDIAGKISIYQCIGSSSKLTANEKIELFRGLIRVNTVGMLSTYKDTKKLDELGRRGEGKIKQCRVAIYKGMDKQHNLVFLTFNGNYFHTKLHYAMDNDGEVLNDLVTDIVKVQIHQVGLLDRFLGTDHHFLLPIQYKLEDCVDTYKEDYDGNIVQQTITLPEHIKIVLEDFRKDSNGKQNKYAEYNEVELINAIGKTMRILDKKRASESEE